MAGKRRKVVMEESEFGLAIARMAHEVVERNRGASGLVVVGIRKGGIFLARRMASELGRIEGIDVPVGELDITLYRDDSHMSLDEPIIHKTEIPCSIQGKVVLLVDDVLFTGRTIRAALDSLMHMGRPSRVQLLSMVDRGHRELPIHADFVGKSIPTAMDEQVVVTFREAEGKDQVILEAEERGA